MKRTMRRLVLAATMLGLMVWTAIQAEAGVYTGTFPDDSSTSSGHVGFGDQGPDFGAFFRSGDQVSQTYGGTGLGDVSELALDVNVDRNFLHSGGFVDLDVRLNGITVGSFIWTQAEGTGIRPLDFAFSPIVGAGTYTLQLIETNNVPPGLGSIAIAKGSEFTLTSAAVPEPSSLALIGIGSFFRLGIWRRRRARTAQPRCSGPVR